MTQPLKAFDILKESLRFTFAHPKVLVKMLWLPFLVDTLFTLCSSTSLFPFFENSGLIEAATEIISIFLICLTSAFWEPKWIRHYYKGAPLFPLWHRDQTTWLYFRKSLLWCGVALAGALAFLVFLCLVLIGVLVFFRLPLPPLPEDIFLFLTGISIIGFVVLYILFRTSFLLPSVAVGKPLTLRQSWTLSKGLSFKYFLIFFILDAPFLGLGVSLPKIVGWDKFLFLHLMDDFLILLWSPVFLIGITHLYKAAETPQKK